MKRNRREEYRKGRRRRIQLWCSIKEKERKERRRVKTVRRAEEGVGKGDGKGWKGKELRIEALAVKNTSRLSSLQRKEKQQIEEKEEREE